MILEMMVQIVTFGFNLFRAKRDQRPSKVSGIGFEKKKMAKKRGTGTRYDRTTNFVTSPYVTCKFEGNGLTKLSATYSNEILSNDNCKISTLDMSSNDLGNEGTNTNFLF